MTDRRLIGFAIVGIVGFAVDGGMLTVLATGFNVNVFVSRAISFCSATLVTWALNRQFVFVVKTSQARRSEYARYFVVQAGGALANLGVFAALLQTYPALKTTPVVPLAFGAGVGLLWNFVGSRWWVFRPSSVIER